MKKVENTNDWRADFAEIQKSEEWKSQPKSYGTPQEPIALSDISDYITEILNRSEVVDAIKSIIEWSKKNPGILPKEDRTGTFPTESRMLFSDFRNWYRFKSSMKFNSIATSAADAVIKDIIRGEIKPPPDQAYVEELRKKSYDNIDFSV